MLGYIARRLAFLPFTLLLVAFVTFVILRITGNPIDIFLDINRTPEQVAELTSRLHLDEPFYVVFGYVVKNTVNGDEYGWPGLGYSYTTKVPVKEEIAVRAPRTLWLIAGAAFLIRVVSALLAFISQILLARWMGGFDFGIYIYAWTWVLLIGGMVDLGLGSASQRLIPEYTEHGQFALLRGYLRGSRFLATAIACAIALAGAAAVTLLRPYLGPETTVPLYLSCAALPMFGLGQVLSGIARSYDWVNLGLAPTYVLRQIALLALMGLAYALGLPTDATTATLLGVAALWSVTIGQLVVLDRRLARTVAKGPQAYAVRSWLAVSAPIFVVEAFYLLLTYSDVIVLKQFRPPDEVAIYYAAAKTLALVAFIYFSVA